MFAACGALGQPFPSKPIHLIVPFAVGGANDLNGRSLQIPLSQALGGTVNCNCNDLCAESEG